MYLCQCLERNTDARYRSDWRVVFYKLVAIPGAKSVTRGFKWKRDHVSQWYTRRTVHDMTAYGGWETVETAQDHCRRRGLRHDIPEFDVHDGKLLTARQAVKITGIANPMCFDFLAEQDLDAGRVVPLPPKPTKRPPTKLEIATKKQQQAEARLERIDQQIRRLENLRTKWARKQKFHARRVNVLSSPKTELETSTGD